MIGQQQQHGILIGPRGLQEVGVDHVAEPPTPGPVPVAGPDRGRRRKRADEGAADALDVEGPSGTERVGKDSPGEAGGRKAKRVGITPGTQPVQFVASAKVGKSCMRSC